MKLTQKMTKEDAVSPVIGVMLMLVVTIIIAAVVAAFAGGLAGSTEAAPNAILKIDDYKFGTVDQTASDMWSTYVEGWKDYGSSSWGAKSNYGIYNMTITHKGGEPLLISMLTLKTTFNGATYSTPLKDVYVGDKGTISAGETIELSAYQGKDIKSDYVYGINQQSLLSGEPVVEWSILDTSSSNVIASGKIVFEQPTPAS